ncbi:FAD-binding oxidoreductase [Xylanimonas protaetiae]|nr:FAD-binding protein [Xylanimonas protaetiae]
MSVRPSLVGDGAEHGVGRAAAPTRETVQSTGARVRARTPADVARVLGEAAASGHRVTTTAPAGPGTVLLDLSAFDTLSVAPVERTVRVGAGVTWARLVAQTAPHGLAVLPGDDPGRTAPGHALSGAIGAVARTFGLAADHVLSADLVTPDGALRTVTADADADLFRALRGGAAGLGVVTTLTFGMPALTDLRAGTWWFDAAPAPEAAALLHRWRAWLADLPESMSTRATLTATGDGKVAVALRFAHVGEPAEGAALLAELADEVPAPARDTVAHLRVGRDSGHLREAEGGVPAAARGALLPGLPAQALDAVVAAAASAPPGSTALLKLRGGAIARSGPFPGSVPGRDAAFALRATAAAQADADAVVDAVASWATRGTTLDLGDPRDARTAEALRVAWGEESYGRITRLRAALDPQGVLVAPWEADAEG